MLVAAGIGVLSVLVGLIISYHANTSGSATMAVMPIALFFVVLAWRSMTRRARNGAVAVTL
jgi:manganese/iron transport system permease protein